MKKTEVMQVVSRVRAACELSNHALKNTAHRLKQPDEPDGPDARRPWLIPLSEEERREKIVEAVVWSLAAKDRAVKAYAAVWTYAADNGVTPDMIEARLNGGDRS